MPFVEILRSERYGSNKVRINDKYISLNKNFRPKFPDFRGRVFFDEENDLIGLQPSAEGYKIGKSGQLYCQAFSERLGVYKAWWNEDKNMIIVDLKQKS